jgi:hypothetical protein
MVFPIMLWVVGMYELINHLGIGQELGTYSQV